jgi:hypothetical protein
MPYIADEPLTSPAHILTPLKQTDNLTPLYRLPKTGDCLRLLGVTAITTHNIAPGHISVSVVADSMFYAIACDTFDEARAIRDQIADDHDRAAAAAAA